MSAAPAAPAPASAPRGRMIGARTLLVLGVLLALVSILSTYVKQEALDESQFKHTSQRLVASPAIQEQVAATLVDTLYANVDVSAELTNKLPDNLQGLAAPLAGISHELVDRGAKELLARPAAQETFVAIASAAQQEMVKVLHGDTRKLDTSNGNVVLDLRPLVLKLGDRFGFDLADKIPPGSAQITILQPDNLKLAQDITHRLEQIANYIWVFALASWIGAIWLARGRRRQEVRALGIGLLIVGVLVLLTRWLTGRYLVDNLVQSDSVRPAVSDAWNIITDPLAAAGWVVVSVGLLVTAGAWLIGAGETATMARSSLAPFLQRAEIAWGAWVVGMALIIWILPVQVFRTTLLLIVAGATGFEVFRRQVTAEALPGSSGNASTTP